MTRSRSLNHRSLVSILISALVSCPAIHAQPASVLDLPQPGVMVDLSSSYAPVLVKGLRVHPENPILFDFILDTGNSGLAINSDQLRSESDKLIKYFLASLTIPEDDLWVNLSPYESNRIIPEQLGQTLMGRDMLAQDYILKQLTASVIYPEKELGKEFWNKVYTKVPGSTSLPVNTFNKVWIVADKAKVYVRDNTAFVVDSHMKVMLEEDYLATQKHQQGSTAKPANAMNSQVVREVVVPELEKEVNSGKNFANLRQIYHSMILATWYKRNLKEALLNQVYSNKAKTSGIDVEDKTIKEQIYQEYLKAYKKGVYSYIKEDMQPDGQVIARKYFSGGEILKIKDLVVTDDARDPDAAMLIKSRPTGEFFNVRATTPFGKEEKNLAGPDAAMNAKYSWAKTEAVAKFIEGHLKSVFRKPFGLNPGVTDASYVRSYPGVRDWKELFLLASEASRGRSDEANLLARLIDFTNVLQWLKNNLFASLKPAPQKFMSDFRTDASDREALKILKDGEFFIEILAGGAAERAKQSLVNLGIQIEEEKYRIWNIRFWDIIITAQQGNLQPKGDAARVLVEAIKDIEVPEPEKRQDNTVGQRALYAISKGIEELQGFTDEDKIESRENLKLVVHVNDDILQSATDDLLNNKFFGFRPSNIVLVNGGYGPGYTISDNGLREEKGVKVTWNHLFAFMENKWKKTEVYSFDDKTKARFDTQDTVNNFLKKRRAKYGLLRRINDATLLHPAEAMDLEFFSSFLGARQKYKQEKKKAPNVFYQVMPNIGATNKGGIAVTHEGMGDFSFPYEGIDAQDFRVQNALARISSSPYNRLLMGYELEEVNQATDNHKVPLSIKIKQMDTAHGKEFLVSPESPVGNVLLVPGVRGLAVQRTSDLLFERKIMTPDQEKDGQYTPGYVGHIPGERIHDIKTVEDFINSLPHIYHYLDRHYNLKSFVDQLPEPRYENDEAMTIKNMNQEGGIDLNSRNLQVGGEGIDFKFDPAMLEQIQRRDFSGVTPILIQITPLKNPFAPESATSPPNTM